MNRRRPLRILAAALLATAAVVALGDHSAFAAACGRFRAIAAADGARVGFASPGFLLVEQSDGGAPAAQAAVDSAGASTAYAGYPYPGDAALSVLPLAGTPRETYPLVAEASFPARPDAEADAGGVALQAHAEERAATASGRGGVENDDSTTGLTKATADVSCAENGAVTAVGESITEGVSFGAGTLRLGRIRSFAKVTIGADGRPTVESALEATQVSVAGQTVGVNEGGLILGAGAATPLPGNPLAEVLADAGIDVDYVAPVTQPDGAGVTAPALRVTLSRELVGTAATAVTYTFGRTYATANGGSDSGSGGAEDFGVIGDGPVGAGLGSAALPDLGSTGDIGPDAGAPTNSAVAAGRVVDRPGGLANARGSGAVVGFSSWSIYAVLVAAAVAMFGGSVILRKLGVRLGWT